jgi:hypothetical protein
MIHPSESQLGEVGFLSDPQRWNKYAYTRNNPLRYVDPDGRETQATLDARAVREAGQTLGDVIVGAGKGLWNALAGTANLVNNFINAEARAFGGNDVVPTVPEAQYDNTTQAVSGIVAPILTALPEMEGTGAAAAPTTAGGRLGSPTTRAQNAAIADSLESRGFTVTGGGGRLPEEYIPGPGGARQGSNYVDVTATRNGRTVRVQTIDTRADGVTPTTREANNAARIRSQQKPRDHTVLIPKKKPDEP